MIPFIQHYPFSVINAIVNTTESNTTILKLPEETEPLIKASVAEHTLKAYQRAVQNLTIWLFYNAPIFFAKMQSLGTKFRL